MPRSTSHFDKVVDPGAGSYFIEELTTSLANEAWKIFLNVGTLFNYIARVFSAGSSIVNNVNVIVTTIQTLNKFKLTGKN